MFFLSHPILGYIDGACSGNPGKGGWGVYLEQGDLSQEICGGDPSTTNNRMEMMAAIKALEAIPAAHDTTLITDSLYLKNGITSWIYTWKKNSWKTSTKKDVKNQDLWILLDTLIQRRSLQWRWVKGHSGNPGNERADRLAREGMLRLKTS